MSAAFSDDAAHLHQAKIQGPTISRNPSPQHDPHNHSTPTATAPPPLAVKPDPTTAKGPPPLSIKPHPRATPSIAPSPSAPVNKMSMASVISPDPTPPPQQVIPKVSMTTKEWIVPPRPKPGRKPATDTPPTKRKAQNRAAQRAFRERRAARVGELEEQMEELKEQREKSERELKDKIHSLELDLQSFRSKCSLLEDLLERERRDRIRVESEAEGLRRKQESFASGNHSHMNEFAGSRHPENFVGLGHGQSEETGPGARKTTQSLAISQIISPPDQTDPLPDTTDLTCGRCKPEGPCACVAEVLQSVQTIGCGKCSAGTGCQCIEEVLSTTGASQQPKRSVSPSSPVSSGKRMRTTAEEPPAAAMEMDFTHAFKKNTSAQPAADDGGFGFEADTASRVRIPPKDQCGFCTEGSYCVCADTTLPTSSLGDMATLPSMALNERQELSPPPELDTLPSPVEITSSGAVKIRPRQKLPTSPVSTPRCGPGGPGTCAQCLADPQSGLFCRSLAAINSSKGGSGCCGGGGSGEGCCKSKKASSQPVGISCADTYKTLSSHRNFSQAFEEIGTWLPKLKVVERPQKDEDVDRPGRAAVDIDAASIMATLKFLDVRFRKGRQ
ncbi:hypothetical protein VUR80DRAFT_5872 [Thermomyces stellatus]